MRIDVYTFDGGAHKMAQLTMRDDEVAPFAEAVADMAATASAKPHAKWTINIPAAWIQRSHS